MWALYHHVLRIYYYHYTHLTTSFPGKPEYAGGRKVKPDWIKMRQETTGFWDAVASAGPYATICTLLQTDNHTNTPSLITFYRLDALSDAQPIVSKH